MDISSETEFLFDYEEDDNDDSFEPASELEDREELYSKGNSIIISEASDSSDFEDVNIENVLDLQSVDVFIEQQQDDFQASKKRRGITKIDRDKRLSAHKFHLLCLLASSIKINDITKDSLMQSWCSSLLPTHCLVALKRLRRAEKKARKKGAFIPDITFKDTIKTVVETINGYLGESLALRRKKLRYQQIESTADKKCSLGKKPDHIGLPQGLIGLISNIDDKSYCIENYLWVKSCILASVLRSFSFETRVCFALSPISLAMKHKEVRSNQKGSTSEIRDTNEKLDFESFEPRNSIFAWCEIVLFTSDKWESIDPNTGSLIVNPNMKILTKKDNQMPYIVSMDKKGYLKEIATKFIPSFTIFEKRYRIQPEPNSQVSWWDTVLSNFKAPHQKAVSKAEDNAIGLKMSQETLPTKINDFTNHPSYALEQLLKRNQIIDPGAKIVGKYKGKNVYPRSSVLDLYSKNYWIRKGRTIKKGEAPTKIIKAVQPTNKRKRAEFSFTTNESDFQNELFGLWQTEEISRPQVVNGIIPKNKYNRIELFHKNMLPLGTVHIPINGLAKCCKQLQIEYADPVTSFEFQKGGAKPVVEGVVVLEENCEMLVNFYLEIQEKQRQKQEGFTYRAAIKNWERLCSSLLIKRRLLREYLGK